MLFNNAVDNLVGKKNKMFVGHIFDFGDYYMVQTTYQINSTHTPIHITNYYRCIMILCMALGNMY